MESLIVSVRNRNEPTFVKDSHVKYSTAAGEFSTFKMIMVDMQKEMHSAIMAGSAKLDVLVEDKIIKKRTQGNIKE